MSNLKLNEEMGETICKECNGEQTVNRGVFGHTTCSRCDGKGKLDWIEKVVGAKRNLEKIDMTEFISTYTSKNSNDFAEYHEEFIRILIENQAKEIDKKLLGSFSSPLEHNKNGYLKGEE